jgi:hypothetical protein
MTRTHTHTHTYICEQSEVRYRKARRQTCVQSEVRSNRKCPVNTNTKRQEKFVRSFVSYLLQNTRFLHFLNDFVEQLRTQRPFQHVTGRRDGFAFRMSPGLPYWNAPSSRKRRSRQGKRIPERLGQGFVAAALSLTTLTNTTTNTTNTTNNTTTSTTTTTTTALVGGGVHLKGVASLTTRSGRNGGRGGRGSVERTARYIGRILDRRLTRQGHRRGCRVTLVGNGRRTGHFVHEVHDVRVVLVP